ncbi:MAG: ABC transporter substrate-binding protein [Rhizobiales bacterium]|nr:ABC transporter substrate-binding protein [Hyphomicrobiales bacterium]
MAPLRLTLACWNYDRTGPLATGTIKPAGIELVYLEQPVEETFFRMARHREFDIAEMSLSTYCVTLMKDDPDFIAIPVFPSRMFRHSGIYVSTKSGIDKPQDLAGKRIGCPEFQLTAFVWIRGVLAEEHGVPSSSPSYWTGGEEEPGRPEKISITLPDRFRVRRIGPTQILSQMLADGDLDALYATRMPSTLHTRPGDVRRLFEDSRAAEQDYFRRTQIFPIMHTVVIRRDLYRQHPWIAVSLLKAFSEAKAVAMRDLYELAALTTMLPWQVVHVEETRRALGEDWWPYGLAPNRHVLEKFLTYHHEQGLSHRLLTPEELFAPETLESFKI